jgi:hypothetical protein
LLILIHGEVVNMMFNIVKHRDFMLADDVPSWRVAEELRLQKYGHEYIVVIRAELDPGQEPPPAVKGS